MINGGDANLSEVTVASVEFKGGGNRDRRCIAGDGAIGGGRALIG